jgi:hypothetical protein
MIYETIPSSVEPLTPEQIWGEPTQLSDESAGWGTDHYKCRECGSFTPGYHHKDCQIDRHSA